MGAPDLEHLRFIGGADVLKSGRLAGKLRRTAEGGTSFACDPSYRAAGHPPIAVSLPVSETPVVSGSGAVPPFFAGLLPEGHRLSVLRGAVKTSLDDELSLLLAVGGDAPGDVQVVPEGADPVEPEPLVSMAPGGGAGLRGADGGRRSACAARRAGEG